MRSWKYRRIGLIAERLGCSHFVLERCPGASVVLVYTPSTQHRSQSRGFSTFFNQVLTTEPWCLISGRLILSRAVLSDDLITFIEPLLHE